MQRHRSHGPEAHSLEKALPPAWQWGLPAEQITVLPRLASICVSRTSECAVLSGEDRHWAAGHLSKSTESPGVLPAADCSGAACRPLRAARSASCNPPPPPPLESRCPPRPQAPPHNTIPAALRVREPPGHPVRSARHRRLSPLPLVSLPQTARTPGLKLHSEQMEKGRSGHVETTSISTCASSSSLVPRTSSPTGVAAAHKINPCKPIVHGGAASSCHSELTEAELQAAEEAICAEAAAEMVDSVLPMSEAGNHSDFLGSTCEEVKEEMHGKNPQEEPAAQQNDADRGTSIPLGLLLPDEESDNSDSDMDMVAGMRAAGRVRQNANFAATISFIVGQHFGAATANKKEVNGKESTEAGAGRQRHVLVGQPAQSGCTKERQDGQCPSADTCEATAAPHKVTATSCGECNSDAASTWPKSRSTARNRPLLSQAFQTWLICKNLRQETHGSVCLAMASPDGPENARVSSDARESMDLQIGAVKKDALATPRGTKFQARQVAGLVLSSAIDCGSHASTCLSPSSAACTSRPQSAHVTEGCRGDCNTREPTWTDADRSSKRGFGESQITSAGHEAEPTKLITSGCVLWEISHGEPLPFGVARPTSAASSGMKTPLLR